MKYLVTFGTLISAILILSCKPHKNGNTKSDVKKNTDPDAEFVVFSIDSATSAPSKKSRLDFYYHDSLAYGRPVVIAGQKTRLTLNTPVLLFEANANQVPFFILPQEKIVVKYAGTDSVKMCINGNDQRTNELDFFRRLIKKTGNIYYAFTVMPYQRKVKSLGEVHNLEKVIDDIKKERFQFLSTYKKQAPVSESFIKIAENCISSTAINDSLLLYYNNRILLNNKNLYIQLLTSKIAAIKNVGFLPYQIYFNACNTLLSLITSNALFAIINNQKDFIKRFDFADKNFTGEIKYFLLANTIYNAQTNAVPISGAYLAKFKSSCSDPGYKQIISEKLSEKKDIQYTAGIDNLLHTDGKTIQGMQTVFSKYSGKIMVVDFWASWCSPCRGEMPYTVSLKKLYTHKNIAFISISSDAGINDWLKANNEELLGSDDSFLLLNFDKSAFVKRYKITSIPRYLVIDKNGKLITDDAPRPSDPALKSLINKYL